MLFLKNIKIINFLLMSISSISSGLSTLLYYKNKENEAMLHASQEQINKLLELNEALKVNNMKLNDVLEISNTKINTIATTTTLSAQAIPYTAFITGILILALFGGITYYSNFMPSSGGIDGIVKDSLVQAVDEINNTTLNCSTEMAKEIIDQTAEHFSTSMHASGRASEAIFTKICNIEKCLSKVLDFLSTEHNLDLTNIDLNTTPTTLSDVATSASAAIVKSDGLISASFKIATAASDKLS